MDLICDLVMNGLARLNLPLELNFLCIELCQKNLSFHILDAGFSCYSIILHYFGFCDFPCIIFMKMLWLTLICGGFLVLFKKL
jgi:hypothetical protein